MTIRATGKPEGCKLIRIEADVDILPAGAISEPALPVIARIVIRGDFFAIPEEGFERIEASLAGTRVAMSTPLDAASPSASTLPVAADSLAAVFDSLAAREGVQLFGISGAAVAEVFGRALDAARIQTA